jgi:ATP-dependent Lon protease
MEEALEADRLITMGLLLPGWEKSYFQRPPIAPVVCIGRVVTYSREPNGDFKLMLRGMRRAQIEDELADPTRPFRRAHVRVLDDRYSPLNAHERAPLQQRLVENFSQFFPADSEMRRPYDQLLGSPLPLGPLTDILAFSVGFDVAFKQQLLAELDVDRRAQMLLEALDSVARPRDFPPGFSAN